MAKKEQSIEEMLLSLQDALDRLSAEGIGLDESIEEYAGAAKLIDSCHKKLKKAELRITEIDAHLAALGEENEL